MPTTKSGTVEPAAVGLTFDQEIHDHPVTYTVVESCGANNGAWYCVTHKLSFRHNFDKDMHISRGGHHVLAWACFEHGPEVP